METDSETDGLFTALFMALSSYGIFSGTTLDPSMAEKSEEENGGRIVFLDL